ncbi:MAG: NUDIX domain-containing protein [bacterium]
MKFYCLKCGQVLTKKQSNLYKCTFCKYTHYMNPYTTTSIIIINKKEEIMLVKRKFPPKKGFWDLPGGFVNIKESAEACSRREIKEELGINLKKLVYVGSYPDKYFFQKVNWDTLTLWYVAEMPNEKIKVSDDISGYKFFSSESIPFNKLAFINLEKAIKAYLKLTSSLK